MFFAVNIGNTNSAVSLFGDGLLAVERLDTAKIKGPSDFEKALDAVAGKSCASGEIEGSILASVVPGLTGAAEEALGRAAKRPPMLVGPAVDSGLDLSAYSGLLGADRIAACAAGRSLCRSPFVAVDMGTATTVNAVDANGVFLGGAILPGFFMGLAALRDGTAQLPKAPPTPPESLFGRDTEGCLVSGAYFGGAALLDGLVNRMAREMTGDVTAFLTGGAAPAVLPYCETRFIHVPELLLEGLAVLYRKNK